MARVFDLAMTHGLDSDDFFIHRIQERCAQLGMNFFLIEPIWLEPFRFQFEQGNLSVRVLLNMHSEHHNPSDPFLRLIHSAAEKGVMMIDDPRVALDAFDKARFHARLVREGMPVPTTVIVGHEELSGYEFTPGLFAALGSTFVIKPAKGYGRRGVVLNASAPEDLRRSAAAWPDSHYLLQERIRPRLVNDQPMYFRAFHVFGKIHVCLWNCFTDAYSREIDSTDAEFKDCHGRITELVNKLASLCGMKFFSTEIAIDGENKIFLIDYVNDQCHMLTKSSSPGNGVPDDLVRAVAFGLVEGARSLIRQS